jgi:hypothetical protein
LFPSSQSDARIAPGSFRDPQGFVIASGDRIFRAIVEPAAKFPDTWALGGPLASLVETGDLWPSHPRASEEVPAEVRALAPQALGFLEHPALAPITYPFEWPFTMLKRAALLHLRIHRLALARGFNLADGSAYNVQFVGTRPVFLDALAFVPHTPGQAWAGYTQFCESFLSPLILASRGCASWAEMFRGHLRGIPLAETSRQLGLLGAIAGGVFIHVYLHAKLAARPAGPAGGRSASAAPTLAGLDLMLRGLERTISRLRFPGANQSTWSAYEGQVSYASDERAAKHAAVRAFIERHRTVSLLDLGCNAGEYSQVAIEAGAQRVIGLERDHGALERAVVRADGLAGRFMPLCIDLQNPTPWQGWGLLERTSANSRLHCDSLLCLALVHHLTLGAGIPLPLVLRDVTARARNGLIEFVPKEDPMSAQLTSTPRLLHPYDLAEFRRRLAELAEIRSETKLTASGRVLFEYVRRD